MPSFACRDLPGSMQQDHLVPHHWSASLRIAGMPIIIGLLPLLLLPHRLDCDTIQKAQSVTVAQPVLIPHVTS